MSTIPLVIGKTMKYGEWLFDRDLEARDNAALIAYDRREEIEKAVDFSDLLEECCEFTEAQREIFMQALARGSNADVHLIYCLLDQMKEQIVKRRLAGGV
jgi:uncharacterized protein CbrC (UPF0167 family)